MARALGLSPSSLFLKLAGGSAWKAWEVAAVAQHFGVSVGDLYSGLGGVFARPAVVAPAAVKVRKPRRTRDPECAWRDSNPQPSDP